MGWHELVVGGGEGPSELVLPASSRPGPEVELTYPDVKDLAGWGSLM